MARAPKFTAPERFEAPVDLDRRLAMFGDMPGTTAAIVRRHVDEYFRLRPNDALRLSGKLLQFEGLGADRPEWRRLLVGEVKAHVSASIRCEVGLVTWLSIAWKLYRLISFLIDLYYREPKWIDPVIPAPARSSRSNLSPIQKWPIGDRTSP